MDLTLSPNTADVITVLLLKAYSLMFFTELGNVSAEILQPEKEYIGISTNCP